MFPAALSHWPLLTLASLWFLGHAKHNSHRGLCTSLAFSSCIHPQGLLPLLPLGISSHVTSLERPSLAIQYKTMHAVSAHRHPHITHSHAHTLPILQTLLSAPSLQAFFLTVWHLYLFFVSSQFEYKVCKDRDLVFFLIHLWIFRT